MISSLEPSQPSVTQFNAIQFNTAQYGQSLTNISDALTTEALGVAQSLQQSTSDPKLLSTGRISLPQPSENSTGMLAQLISTVSSLLETLGKVIQGLVTSANAQSRTPQNSNSPTVGSKPIEEPPTVITVPPFEPPKADSKNTTSPAQPNTVTPAPSNSSGTPATSKPTTSGKKTKKTPPKKSTKPSSPSGTKKPPAKSTPAKNTINGRGQFLWKPTSDKDGKLAVLLPPNYTGRVKSLQILTPQGDQVLATGKAAGTGNGDREHFRFDRSGGSFPDGSIVAVTLLDGTVRQVQIKESSARFTA
jgi:hypothetical protein